MAAAEATDGKKGSEQPAVAGDGDVGELGAGGQIAALAEAGGGEDRGERATIEGEESGGKAGGHGRSEAGSAGAPPCFGADEMRGSFGFARRRGSRAGKATALPWVGARLRAVWTARKMMAISRLRWANSRVRTERRG